MLVEKILFYLFLIDSVGANLVIWFGEEWYTKHFRLLSRIFPPSKAWSLVYLGLVIWIGTILYRAY